jgi:hypothetical protein
MFSFLSDNENSKKEHYKEKYLKEKERAEKYKSKLETEKYEDKLKNQNEKYIIRKAIENLGGRVTTLESEQYFTLSPTSENDIYTFKNLLVSAENNIFNSKFFVESMSINRIIQVTKIFYNSIIITNDLVKQILANAEQIKIEGFQKVLGPYVDNNYYQPVNYFQILTIPTNSDITTEYLNNNKILYTYRKYLNYTGKSLNDLIELDTLNTPVYFKGESDDFLNIFNLNYYFFKQFNQIGSKELNYFTIPPKFLNACDIYYSCAVKIPGIFEGIEGINPDYIVVQSSVNLAIISKDLNQTVFTSPEYLKYYYGVINAFINIQATYNNLINNPPVFSDLIAYDLWEYNTTTPETAICLYSTLYKDWIGKPAFNAVILGTDFNVGELLSYIINFNNKNLLLKNDQEVGLIQYSFNNNDYVYITKLVTINAKLYIIITNLLLNEYFNDSIRSTGDVTIEGAVTVNNWDGKNIFNLHTETSTLQVNGKIGINKQEPVSLLDIQSISTIEINSITNEYINLNKFVFSYYDYFIDNFSTTTNRDWNTIYDTQIDKAKISVTTINIPFDFKTTTSSDQSFKIFIDKFNSYVYFGFVEEEFKEMFQGKTASQIKDPYYQPYFGSLKDYFLIMWNQRDYYLLNGYQTFTNIVNYFGGPVLRMQVMWYDEQYNLIRLFATNLRLDKYLLNQNLNEILSSYYNSLFSCEQLVNLFSNLLKDPVIQAEQVNDPLYLTNYVSNSYYKQRFGYPQNYIFCYEFKDLVEEQKYLFHELFTYWAGNQAVKLQVPNQDVLVSSALNQIDTYITDNFNTQILDRILIGFYFWQFEYKVSYVKIIDIQGKKYIIGSGVDILVYIKKNILSSGDQQFNGSLKILDPVSNQTVLTLDTTEKQVSIQYPLGLGTEYPRSLLTIEDVSITNLFDYLDELSKKNRYITDLSKQLNGLPSSNYQNIIENYINPFTGLPYVQDVDNYFVVVNPFDTNLSDILNYEYNYHWYLKTWENILYKNVLNPNFDVINRQVKPLAGNFFTLSPLNEVMFNLMLNLKIYNWIWGKKVSTSKYFLDSNNSIRFIFTGVNFNLYFTRFTSNKNLQNVLYASQAIQIYLNLLYLDYYGNSPLNQSQLTLFLQQIRRQYQTYTIWVMDYPSDYNNTRLFLNQDGDLPTNFENLRPTATIFNMLYNYDNPAFYHGNLTFEQVLLYYQKIINLQQKIQFYNGLNTDLTQGDSNIVGYRTDENYWLSSWIYMNITTLNPVESVNVISIMEFNVDDYLNQSLQMIGDLQMAGNLTLMNPKEYLKYVKNELPLSALNPLVSIYPEEEFVGIGSQKIYTQYALNYKTIDLEANQVFAKNHVVVSNPFYPNLVGERNYNPIDPVEKDDAVKTNLSAFTVRRATNQFTLEEIVDLGEGNFGFDISYEVEDKYQDTYEVAESGVRIKSLKTFSNGLKYPVPTYFWDIVDDANSQNNILTKNLMELDSTGRLTVNKIKLGDYDLEVIKNGDGTQTLKWGNINIGTQPNL